ncbi:MAG TPA: potassium channel family protein [Acidimicrobiales bacterium]|jgi:voltage-gated potassium channel|nr:potassium channel family protein [Acidimicrobiales bacterium]
MLALTILWTPVLIIPLVTSVHGSLAASFDAVDYTVWALFSLEYIIKLWLAPNRGRFFRSHILDLLIVAVPFFRPLRMGRLVRLLRLARVGVVLVETLRRARSILTHNGFHFVVLAAGILVFACAGLVTFAERHAPGSNIHDFGQGLWWAIVTVTTVGYGDRYPVTPFGQGVAVLLMLVGIGLIGTLTATVASYFVQEKTTATDERLERIESLLAQLLASGTSAPPLDLAADMSGTLRAPPIQGD